MNAIYYDYAAQKIKAVIDQHFQESKWIADKDWLNNMRLHYIGGVLQVALFMLPLDRYYEIKQYIYTEYGYDPGGCKDKQINIFEALAGDKE